MADTSPYLAWWTSIETDLRKSLLVGARQDPERLHNLLRTAFEAGQSSATPPSPSTAPEVSDDSNPLYRVLCIALGTLALHDHKEAERLGKMGRSALASRPAEVDDEGLPPLPLEAARAFKGQVAFFVKWSETGKALRGELLLFTAEQYRQGQRDAVAADRARRGDRS